MIALLMLLAGCASGSGQGASIDSDKIWVYYPNSELNGLTKLEYEGDEPTVDSFIEELSKNQQDEDVTVVLGKRTALNGYTLSENQIILDFDNGYGRLGRAEEVLFRASLVHTLTQLDAVHYVTITIEGNPLKLVDGEEPKAMSDRSFIENAGKEINAYAQTTLHLYFADSSGKELIRYEESTVYSTNISKERLVVDKLIEGPDGSDAFPTISPDTKVNSVDVRDGICYVDLSSAIVDQPYNVTEEAVFYSLVNSLCEVRGVDRVQLSIDGETKRIFQKNISLDRPYEKKLELVAGGK
ncbi:MAG: GerMN domain-containing protein [Lachnospiraceae bacterium]|nr:GerMN domain-containing protein [Lachnospiraceae bacterium]